MTRSPARASAARVRALGTDPLAFAEAVRGLVEVRLEQQRRASEQGGWTARGGGAAVAAEHVVVLIDDYDPAQLAPLAPQLEVLLARGAELAVTVVLLDRGSVGRAEQLRGPRRPASTTAPAASARPARTAASSRT